MRISVPNRVRGASRIGLLLAIPWLAAASARPAPRPPASFDVAGLSAPVEILTDRWGVPHIFASTLDDAFLAQSLQAARDRLWQIDLWRQRRLGGMAGRPASGGGGAGGERVGGWGGGFGRGGGRVAPRGPAVGAGPAGELKRVYARATAGARFTKDRLPSFGPEAFIDGPSLPFGSNN